MRYRDEFSTTLIGAARSHRTSYVCESFAIDRSVVESLSSSDLLSATRELVRKCRGVEAELLVHLGEIDERRLYLDWAFSSMFAFCVGELGFSEDITCNRINVARAAAGPGTPSG